MTVQSRYEVLMKRAETELDRSTKAPHRDAAHLSLARAKVYATLALAEATALKGSP